MERFRTEFVECPAQQPHGRCTSLRGKNLPTISKLWSFCNVEIMGFLGKLDVQAVQRTCGREGPHFCQRYSGHEERWYSVSGSCEVSKGSWGRTQENSAFVFCAR